MSIIDTKDELMVLFCFVCFSVDMLSICRLSLPYDVDIYNGGIPSLDTSFL